MSAVHGRATNVRIGDIFTDDELRRAASLYDRSSAGRFNEACVREIVTPEVLARINTKLGQENDARYLAYVIEYALMAGRGR